MTTHHADIYKNGVLAGELLRLDDGIAFRYLPSYIDAGGPAIASTLPVKPGTRLTPAGAVPPYFAGLLPEGRRLTALRRTVKTSADDELTLLAAVGGDTIGDVQVTEHGVAPTDIATIALDRRSLDKIRFSELLADVGVTTPPTLSGVQDKASAAMISLPVSRQHERYILKLDPPEHPHLVANEAFFLEHARRFRIPVAGFTTITDADGRHGLLVTRFDRVTVDGDHTALAVEDACQALGRWPADKYAVTMEDTARALMALTSAPRITARDILRQLTFAWLTGNGDLHAKNLSVLATPAGEYRLSPAYDLPSTLLYGDTTLALTVGDRDTLSYSRLRFFASELGLRPAAAGHTVASMLSATAPLAESLTSSELPFDRKLLAKTARQLSARRRAIEGAW